MDTLDIKNGIAGGGAASFIKFLQEMDLALPLLVGIVVTVVTTTISYLLRNHILPVIFKKKDPE